MFHRNPTQLLRALAALLAYPDAELRAALPEIIAAIQASTAIDADHKSALVALAQEIGATEPFAAEERYVDLFDRGRRTCLNVFEHVYGDSLFRGPAMIKLQTRYADAKLVPASYQLPDYLPVLLEYLSCRDLAETRKTIGEIARVLRRIGNALIGKRSRYAAVMGALLALGKEKGLNPDAAPPAPEDLDKGWEEKPAFAPDGPVRTGTPNHDGVRIPEQTEAS